MAPSKNMKGKSCIFVKKTVQLKEGGWLYSILEFI
jgi:hypothetical protein